MPVSEDRLDSRHESRLLSEWFVENCWEKEVKDEKNVLKRKSSETGTNFKGINHGNSWKY